MYPPYTPGLALSNNHLIWLELRENIKRPGILRYSVAINGGGETMTESQLKTKYNRGTSNKMQKLRICFNKPNLRFDVEKPKKGEDDRNGQCDS